MPGQPSQPEDGRSHDGPGVARRVDGGGLPLLDQIHGHVDAGVALAAHHRGLVMHGHRRATGHQLNQPLGDGLVEVVLEPHGGDGTAQRDGLGDETDPDGQQLDRPETAFQDGPRGMVAPHAIHRHPESLTVHDPAVPIDAGSLLEPPQGVEHQGLEDRPRRRCGSAGHRDGGPGDRGGSRGGSRGGVHDGGDRGVAAVPDHQPTDGPTGLGATGFHPVRSGGVRFLLGQRVPRCAGTDSRYPGP